jgi:uncharacterized membrane protein
MDPIIFEFLGGLLVGAMAGLMVVLRIKHPAPKMMPMLAIKKVRSTSRVHRRKTSPLAKGRNARFARMKGKAKAKTVEPGIEPQKTPDTADIAASFDTCPSCGLQAPGSLLAEHFMGSPSHRNGPPKIVVAGPVKSERREETKEDDSKQSVRNLLQMLVPPRAFGRRHAHRAVSPISSIVEELGRPHRRLP